MTTASVLSPRPNFFIVGAPKCGTTAWVSYLSGHPKIGFSRAKEPHYFCEDFPGFRWAESENKYLSFFSGLSQPVIGEASVMYLYSRVAAAKIKAFAPDAQIIVFLRDQQSFLPSFHSQQLYNRDETETDFATAWRAAIEGMDREIPSVCREPAFLDYARVGRFDEQLQRYTDLFPLNQILIVRYEDWTRNPRATYLQILAFLGLADDGRTEFTRVHQAKRHRRAWLARLTQRPPSWVLGPARILKRVLGRERLGVAAALRQFNQDTGYGSSGVSAEVKAEIDAYFADSNARLAALLAQLDTARESRT